MGVKKKRRRRVGGCILALGADVKRRSRFVKTNFTKV
jgi:hypothetical protein